MSRISAILAAALVAACSGNPINVTGTPGPVEPAPPSGELGEPVEAVGVTVPAIVAQNLNAATYDPDAQTLTIVLSSLDGSPVSAAYNRDAALDVAGFEAYTIQETSTQRKFVALFRESPSGRLQAGVVADGGQFVNYFGGGSFARFDTFSLPGSGLASYTGSYVGVLNTGATVPGPGPVFDPVQSDRVIGEVLLNADFNDLSLNGAIRNRVVLETGVAFDPVFLEATGINADGAFSGVAKRTPAQTMGNYAGVFAGLDASEVAGVILVTPVEGVPELREHGAFVLPVCAGGDPSPCP